MPDTRAESNGNVNFFWVPEGGFVNPAVPTESELAAAIDLTTGLVWDGLQIGTTGTNELDDRGVLDKATAKGEGAIQFSATTPFFYPANWDDAGDDYARIRNIFATAAGAAGGVKGFLVVSILQNTRYGVKKPVGGDFVSVYKVISDAFTHDTEGEDSYKFTIEFLPQGFAVVNTMVKGATAGTLTTSAPPTLAAVGAKAAITATLHGKSVTQGTRWSSSDSNIVSVSPNGVVVRQAAGAATITATHTAATAPVTVAIAA